MRNYVTIRLRFNFISTSNHIKNLRNEEPRILLGFFFWLINLTTFQNESLTHAEN